MTRAEQYQQYLRTGELHIPECGSCGKVFMYPRSRCPFCHSVEVGWVRVSGAGTLYSFTVSRAAGPTAFAEDVPYGLGVVELAEGPRLLARLVPGEDGDFGAYRCDLPVVFTPADAAEIDRRPVAWFAPAS